MVAKFYGHNPENCRVRSHKVKTHNLSVKMKIPPGFNNRKQELVTMEKLTLDLIIQKFILYGWILIRIPEDNITVARVIENENKSITNSLTLVVTKSLSWKVILYNKFIPSSHSLFSDIPFPDI